MNAHNAAALPRRVDDGLSVVYAGWHWCVAQLPGVLPGDTVYCCHDGSERSSVRVRDGAGHEVQALRLERVVVPRLTAADVAAFHAAQDASVIAAELMKDYWRAAERLKALRDQLSSLHLAAFGPMFQGPLPAWPDQHGHALKGAVQAPQTPPAAPSAPCAVVEPGQAGLAAHQGGWSGGTCSSFAGEG